jgi:hypothetical protein
MGCRSAINGKATEGHVRAAVADIGPGQTMVQSHRECECDGEATTLVAAVPQREAGAATSCDSGVAAAAVRQEQRVALALAMWPHVHGSAGDDHGEHRHMVTAHTDRASDVHEF